MNEAEFTPPFDLTAVYVESEVERLTHFMKDFPLARTVYESAIIRVNQDPQTYFDAEAARQREFLTKSRVVSGVIYNNEDAAIKTSEFFKDPSFNLYGIELDLQTMSSDELRYHGAHYQAAFLLRLADEKEIVEGAEDMLRQISEPEGGN